MLVSTALALFPGLVLAEEGKVVVSGAAGLAQAGLGLFAVIALILALAWVARRAGLVKPGNAGVMKVVGTTALGPRQRLVLVEVGGTWLVLGVGAGEIRTLHTLPAQDGGAGDAIGAAAASQPMRQPVNPPMSGTFAQRLLRAMQHNLKS
jgi:flagellar protein FliO/FliZ